MHGSSARRWLRAWLASPALARRVSDLETRCAGYEAKLSDIFTTMEAAAEAAGIRPEPGLRLCGGTEAQTLAPASRSEATRARRSPSM